MTIRTAVLARRALARRERGRFGALAAFLALLAAMASSLLFAGPSFAQGTGDSRPQDMPIALDRLYATTNPELDIDGLDDERVDVDIAIMDTGIELDHPDLNIVGRTNCVDAQWPTYQCTSASPSDGDDAVPGTRHGTYSALDIAAIDNNIGRVGIAAGARLWAVDISGEERYGTFPFPDPRPPARFNLEAAIAGVKWVTAHADEIEVVHLAGLCAPEPQEEPLPICIGSADVDLIQELEDALAESLAAGVVYAFTAGGRYHTDTFIPQRFDNDMFFSSEMVDTDGKPGGLGPADCYSPDDETVATSAWGASINVASAGGCSGSGPSTNLTAAAAVLASRDNPDDIHDVRAIGQAIFGTTGCDPEPPIVEDVGAANCDWTDTSGDGVKEPLLDVGDPAIFDPVMVPGSYTPFGGFGSTSAGWDNDLWTRCIKSPHSPTSINYYEDNAECQVGGGNWSSFVNAENTVSSCPGPAGQAFAVNGSNSPARIAWSPWQTNTWAVNLKVNTYSTSQPCVGGESRTQVAMLDHVNHGGGPLPHPSALITSHHFGYNEWRPVGGETRLFVGAIFHWGGKNHRIEVNLYTGGGSDLHPDPRVLEIVNSPSLERLVISGPAIGRAVPKTPLPPPSLQEHWFDWKYLFKLAVEEGWFSPTLIPSGTPGVGPSTAPQETLAVFVAVETKGHAISSGLTTNFRTAGL